MVTHFANSQYRSASRVTTQSHGCGSSNTRLFRRTGHRGSSTGRSRRRSRTAAAAAAAVVLFVTVAVVVPVMVVVAVMVTLVVALSFPSSLWLWPVCWLLVDSGCSHGVCCLLLAVGVDGCCWLVVVAAVVAVTVAVYVVLPLDGVSYVAPAALAFVLAVGVGNINIVISTVLVSAFVLPVVVAAVVVVVFFE